MQKAVNMPHFYPRSPCGERRSSVKWQFIRYIFLSTLSLRRATLVLLTPKSTTGHFYPRSPCGERPCDHIPGRTGRYHFYPRSPCGERPMTAPPRHKMSTFLSTLSLRRATVQWKEDKYITLISIHALLAESDASTKIDMGHNSDFYPRSPCGERPPRGGSCYLDNIISIHALLAESDLEQSASYNVYLEISIHALLAESDVEKVPADVYYQAFLSTLSLRRATTKRSASSFPSISISIHALLAESDKRAEIHASTQQEFLSTLSLRRATIKKKKSTRQVKHFYPRSPCGERL